MKNCLFMFLLCVPFVACQSTGFLMGKATVVMLAEPYPPKTEDAAIDVYYTNRPDQRYIEIAQITCKDTNDEWCLKQLQLKAREIGADGLIILGRATSETVGVPIGNLFYFGEEEYGMRAVAIKYYED